MVVQGERFAFVNSRAAEIAETSVEDMMARGYLERIHPDDHALVQQRRMKRLAGEPVPNRYEIRLRMPDGRVKWVDIGVTLVPWEGGTATLTFFSDVSERKLLEHKLTSTLAEREIVLNTSVVGIAFLTPQGRFRWANPAMLTLFGGQGNGHFHSMEQVYLDREQYLDVGGAVAQAIRKGETFQRELQMRRLDGTVIWVSLSGQAVNHDNLLDGTVWTALDITDRKMAEEGIRMALAQQRELNDLRSRFVSMTSHEFRTPLATILSSAEFLRFYGDRLPEDERLSVIASIESGVQRMTQMLDRVLMLGRSEAGMLDFKPRQQDLVQLCRQLCDEARSTHAGPTHVVEAQLPAEPIHGWFDDKLLRHALGNLLSNALKYSPQGGTVTLVVQAQPGQDVHLAVQDQGIGIPAAEIPHLFTSFHRASNVGDIQGTGLGLAIVKNATELHGGTLSLDSELGRAPASTSACHGATERHHDRAQPPARPTGARFLRIVDTQRKPVTWALLAAAVFFLLLGAKNLWQQEYVVTGLCALAIVVALMYARAIYWRLPNPLSDIALSFIVLGVLAVAIHKRDLVGILWAPPLMLMMHLVSRRQVSMGFDSIAMLIAALHCYQHHDVDTTFRVTVILLITSAFAHIYARNVEGHHRVLDEQREHLDMMVRCAAVGGMEWAVDNEHAQPSERLAAWMGWPNTPGDAPTRIRLQDLVAAEHRDELARLLAQLVQGHTEPHGSRHSPPQDLRVVRPDGQEVWLHAEFMALSDADGKAVKVVATFIDISRLRAAEADTLAALKRQQELNELRARFVAMTSHEFRTPLAAILSSAELLDHYGERLPVDERQAVLKGIHDGVHRMTHAGPHLAHQQGRRADARMSASAGSSGPGTGTDRPRTDTRRRTRT